jgi:hypothetical protein
MPDRDVLEAQVISIVALLKAGEPKETKVQFKLKYGDKEESKEGTLVGDSNSPTSKAATIKLPAPAVPDDQEKVELNYTVIHEKRELTPAEKIVIWPKEGKLTAVDAGDGKTALKGFTYQVIQKKKTPTPTPLRANDTGLGTFQLKPGEAFTIEAVPPFVITDIDKTKPRDLKIKAQRKFTAIFDEPEIPPTKSVKQYVNQPLADNGQKGMGSKILFKVMCKEDKDKTTGLIGAPGIFAYVRATFSGHGGKPSARVESVAAKKPQLILGKDLTAIVEDTDPAKKGTFTAQLELKSGGKGEFEVELGVSGGDTCKIEVGSTMAFADGAAVTYTNWRKVFYEVLAPATMTVPNKMVNGVNLPDLTAGTTQRMGQQSADGYLEWELIAGSTFAVTGAMKAAKQNLPGVFLGRADAEIFQLTDNQAKAQLRASPRSTAGRPLARFILCDSNYYYPGALPAVPDTRGKRTETKTVSIAVYPWLPRSDVDGSAITVQWGATHVAAPKPAVLTWGPDVPGANGSTPKKRVVKVSESETNTSVLIEFTSWIGNINTDVDSNELPKIRTWLTPLCTDAARRARRDKLTLVITGEKDNERQILRLTNTKAAVQTIYAELAKPDIDTHPGLTNAGVARVEDLDPDVVLDMTQCTGGKIVVNLPDALPGDPGNIAGPEDDDHCPVIVQVKYHKHGRGLGSKYNDADLKGDLLIVNDPAGNLCTADTILHELGHLFGLSPYAKPADSYAPGVPIPKSFNQAEIDPWKHNGTQGHLYDRHGHAGGHCAWGLSDVEKATADYSDSTNVGGGSPECLMYGSGPSQDTQRVGARTLCLQCLHLMRARDYSSIA